MTQLFTEDYMVRFLLENSLGAWWAARHPDSPLVKTFEYLRYRDDGTPAAGTFPGWPDRAAKVTCMDPCGGSGHFVVAEFDMMFRMRMEEEGLSAAAAGDAVIRDNLFMLEIDPRCTQIAAFALALAAWKTGGYRTLPMPNIACSGIAVTGQFESGCGWPAATNGCRRRWSGCTGCSGRPTLGSLINPRTCPLNERLFSADYEEVAPLLEKALAKEQERRSGRGRAGRGGRGVAKAARLLARPVHTGSNKRAVSGSRQTGRNPDTSEAHHPEAEADLATVFVERCRSFTLRGHRMRWSRRRIGSPRSYRSCGKPPAGTGHGIM